MKRIVDGLTSLAAFTLRSSMGQVPLHVLWVEPNFPGQAGAVADWLVRRRGYRCSFYCHTADPRATWPASVGKGLDVQTFGVGGVARDASVTWSRVLERSLCYAYGCWEVLEQAAAAADRPDRWPLRWARFGPFRPGLLAGRSGC